MALAQFDYDAAAPATFSPSSSTPCYGSSGTCDADELAAFLFDEWRARIAARLPTGRVRICRDTTPWQVGTRAWRWECDAGATSSAPLWIKLGWQARATFAGDNASSNGPQLVLHVD